MGWVLVLGLTLIVNFIKYFRFDNEMLKLVINSPKGGVGKTTIATNVALLLAAEGKKVLVLKLSSSSRIKEHIKSKQQENPSLYGSITIVDDKKLNPDDVQGLPISFEGMGEHDVVVADTDDYWKILEKLVDKKRIGWRVIAPIVPGDTEGLVTIPDELNRILLQSRIKKFPLKLTIIPNRCGDNNDIEDDINIVKTRLEQKGLLNKLSAYYLPYAGRSNLANFLENNQIFRQQLKLMLINECDIEFND